MKVPVETLKNVTVEILLGLGETLENARKTAEILVRADMRDIPTHGTYLLNVIAMRAENGQLKIPTEAKVISEKDSTAIIDGADGIGMVAAQLALEVAMKKAKEYGVGLALVRNTNNVGCLGCYTECAAEKGFIAIMSCNAAPAMAPWGAAEKFLGTNPISISIPSKGINFTADMATSVVARGKIRAAARKGTSIPDNWALDPEGRPTTDPQKALEGTLMPIGGPKGSSLAMVIDILSGLLAGSGYGNQLKSFHVLEGPTRVGVSCLAVDIAHFMDLTTFKDLMSNYVETVKNLRKAYGVEEILIPGEIRRRNEEKSLKDGIELDEKTVLALNELVKKLGGKSEISISL
jgi:LDH2 family malate/lactate/ureidoglycolate dehydrogenase